jgi:hypothetical protein
MWHLSRTSKKAVREWTNSDHKIDWESLTGLRHEKRSLQGLHAKIIRELLKLNRI